MAEVLKGAIIGCGFFADRHGDIGLPMATVFELERGMGSDRSHTRTNPISVNYHACRSTKLWCTTSIRPAFCLARLIPFMPRPAAGTVTSSAKTRPSWCCRTGAPFMTGSMVHRFLDPDPDGPAMGDAFFEGELGTISIRGTGDVYRNQELVWKNNVTAGHRGRQRSGNTAPLHRLPQEPPSVRVRRPPVPPDFCCC